MREAGLLTKERFREVPPRVDYELTPQAFDLVPVIAALARWGWTHTPAEPQRGEKQDPRALFRMLPALALDTGLTLSDEVALAVRGTGDYYVAGPAENEDAPSPVAVRRVVGDFEATPVAVSQIVGDEDAWIDAVTNAVFDGLRIIGFDTVIDGVLRTLAGQPVGLSFCRGLRARGGGVSALTITRTLDEVEAMAEAWLADNRACPWARGGGTVLGSECCWPLMVYVARYLRGGADPESLSDHDDAVKSYRDRLVFLIEKAEGERGLRPQRPGSRPTPTDGCSGLILLPEWETFADLAEMAHAALARLDEVPA